MNRLLDKYNRPVPRYTSYPPANFFHTGIGERDFLEAVEQSNDEAPSLLSFYIHFPYCEQKCFYCGCNSYLRSKEGDDEVYFEAVLNEIDRVIERIDGSRNIAQIHFGGGSPSLADPRLLGKVMDRLISRFAVIEKPEIAIECHPGHLTREGYEALLSLGFTRVSLGVQDFNPEVLKVVHRTPPLLPIEEVQRIMLGYGVPLNLDFIYGLPLQTVESFEETIKRAIALHPSRLVTFSYAHVPSMFAAQKILEQRGLPSSEVKEEMYQRARKLLIDNGYLQIGLDHFVLPSDELHQAAVARTLHRNFQGYCTRRTTGQVYAFGVSAISQLTSAYVQNTKDIPTYLKTIKSGHLPIDRGLLLTREQKIIREVITTFMCNERISWSDLAGRLQLTPEEVKGATAFNEKEMEAMAQDGLIFLSGDEVRMATPGSPLLRYVASRLDPLQSEGGKIYSKPV